MDRPDCHREEARGGDGIGLPLQAVRLRHRGPASISGQQAPVELYAVTRIKSPLHRSHISAAARLQAECVTNKSHCPTRDTHEHGLGV